MNLQLIGCIGKEPFETKGAAIRVLERQRKEKRLHRNKGRAQPRPYLCSNCHHWHIGSYFA